MSPAVNLALEEVPFAILEAVKARILANRRRLAQGRDDQKPPPSLKPRPQLRKFGANSKTYRRPEPAATGGKSNHYSTAWLAYDNRADVDDVKQRLFSLDATASKELVLTKVSHNYPTADAIQTDWSDRVDTYILPINSESYIFVISFASCSAGLKIKRAPNTEIFDSPFTLITQGTASNAEQHAYFVGRSVVKEINMPTSLRDMVKLNSYLPSGTYVYPDTYLDNIRPRIFSTEPISYYAAYAYYFAGAKFMDITAGYVNDILEEQDAYYMQYDGPGCYALFNNYESAIALCNTLYDESQMVSGNKWQHDQIYDFINSPYLPKRTLAISTLDLTGTSALEYIGPTLLPTDSARPMFAPIDGVENPVWKRAGRTKNPAVRPTSPYPPNDYGYNQLAMHVFWDWGAPAYCREQLLQLGFSAADITP